ncbi:hypothetical protein llap_16239 [Limosa lapponica baueri]|uniref:Uncharacterized protein n=1 Tax=Limosa lapponica baueri TaxID=1758121 RepID=A0A2I0TI07_LIMLA|nr:hypothetical protein llap_16239 [Limosa lapponica baueri]
MNSLISDTQDMLTTAFAIQKASKEEKSDLSIEGQVMEQEMMWSLVQLHTARKRVAPCAALTSRYSGPELENLFSPFVSADVTGSVPIAHDL